MMEGPARAEPMRLLTRDRCIEMLNNFANGNYQAIDPFVCGLAAKFLRGSTPNRETVATVPDYTAMNGPDMLAACRDDGAKWAAAFCQHIKKHGHAIDEDLMLGWFANAIEHSHDVRTGRGPTVLPDGSAFFTGTVG